MRVCRGRILAEKKTRIALLIARSANQEPDELVKALKNVFACKGQNVKNIDLFYLPSYEQFPFAFNELSLTGRYDAAVLVCTDCAATKLSEEVRSLSITRRIAFTTLFCESDFDLAAQQAAEDCLEMINLTTTIRNIGEV